MKKGKFILAIICICLLLINGNKKANAYLANTTAYCKVTNYKNIKEAKKKFADENGVIADCLIGKTKLKTKYGLKKCTILSNNISAGVFRILFEHRNKVYNIDIEDAHIMGISRTQKYILTSLSASEYTLWKYKNGVYKVITYTDNRTKSWEKKIRKKYSIIDIKWKVYKKCSLGS